MLNFLKPPKSPVAPLAPQVAPEPAYYKPYYNAVILTDSVSNDYLATEGTLFLFTDNSATIVRSFAELQTPHAQIIDGYYIDKNVNDRDDHRKSFQAFLAENNFTIASKLEKDGLCHRLAVNAKERQEYGVKTLRDVDILGSTFKHYTQDFKLPKSPLLEYHRAKEQILLLYQEIKLALVKQNVVNEFVAKPALAPNANGA